MKICILTLHSQNNNYGSVLQAYSLYSYMQELGHDVTVINYQPYYSNGATSLKMFVRKLATNIVFLPQYIIRKKNFKRILNREKKTKKYSSYLQLQKADLHDDIFVIGSDQVWNPNYLCGNDPAYTFQFIKNRIKISYAASLGTDALSNEQIVELVEKTKSFSNISLREYFSAMQFQKAGRTDAKYVLDPVFLHGREYYRKLEIKPKTEGYILAYIMSKDPFIASVVDAISKKYNKKIIQIGGFAPKCNYDTFDRTAGPEEFLGFVDHADIVVTSSFHGLAFSHIFEKQFLVVMPHDNTLRLENLLESFGTTDRIITEINEVSRILDTKINYQKVNEKIDLLRQESCRYLEDALINCVEKKNDL